MGKNIVHLPTVKAHSYTVTTGAMKNAFGGLLYLKRHYTHTWIHDTLVDLLAIQKEIHTGFFATMDGTTAGSGAGPRTMVPHQKDVILGSSDQVAIDAIAALMMGFDPMKIQYIAHATERGLGQGDPRQIEVVGQPELADERWGFTVNANFATGTGLLLVALTFEDLPEAPVSHSARQGLHLRQRDLSRSNLVPRQGNPHHRRVETAKPLGPVVRDLSRGIGHIANLA